MGINEFAGTGGAATGEPARVRPGDGRICLDLPFVCDRRRTVARLPLRSPVLVIEKLKGWFLSQGWAVRLALLVTAVTRVWFAAVDHSVFWPDEIYQSIEPAHRLAFGYGLLPWEFRDGARSWIFPALLALPLKLVALLHVHAGLALVLAARLVMVALALVAAVAGIEYARRLAGKPAALIVAFAFAFFPPLLVYSHRTLQEAASAPLVMLVPLCLLERSGRAAVWAGLAVGLATLLRFQCAIVAATFFVSLVFERRWRHLRLYAGAGVCVALGGGLLDWLTWGRPFHSFIAYLEFNLIKSGASTFGVSPRAYFLQTLWSSSGPAVVLIGIGLVIGGLFAARATAAAALMFLLIHSAVPHKEFRFLLPVFPLMLSVGGVGLALALARFKAPAWAASLLTALLCLGFADSARGETYARLGQYLGTSRASGSAWHTEEGPNLLLSEAGERADTCGVLMLGARAAFTGGYSYLHRRVPLFYRFQACDDAGAANYIIAALGNSNVPPEYELAKRADGYGLYRRNGACGSAPDDFDEMLDGADDMGLGRGPIHQPNPHELDIHAGSSAAAFVSGWGNGEHLDCRHARWAIAAQTRMVFPLQPSDALYSFAFTAEPYWRSTPQRVRIKLNGEPLDDFALARGWRRYQTLIRRGLLRKGRNQLDFTFDRVMRAEGDDTRKLAAVFDELEVAPADTTLSIDVGSDEARRYLGKGFSDVEHDGSRTFAWSDGPRTELKIPTLDTGAPTVFEVVARAYRPVVPLTVSVSLNDHPAGTFTLGAEYAAHALLLPGQFLDPISNVVALSYDRTAKPSDHEPGSSDERALAAAYDAFLLRPLPTTTRVDFGAEDARIFQGSGFSGDESAGVRTFVWSDGPRSTIWLRAPADAVYAACHFEIVASAFAPVLPLDVTVSLNGARVGSFAPTADWAKYTIPLDAHGLLAGANTVEFDYSRTARPSDTVKGSTDTRELAAGFDRFEAVCTKAASVPAHAR